MLITDQQFKVVARLLDKDLTHYTAEVHNELGNKILFFGEVNHDADISSLDDSHSMPLWLMIKKLVLADERNFSVLSIQNLKRKEVIAKIDAVVGYDSRHHVIDEEEFFAVFKPQLNHLLNEESVFAYETCGDDLDYVVSVSNEQPHRVWTVMDSDSSDNTIIVEGYHLVNRISYLITELEAHPTHTYEITH